MFNLILCGNRQDINGNKLNDFWPRTEGYPIPIRQNFFARILEYLHIVIQMTYIGLKNLLLHHCECSEQSLKPHSKSEGTLPELDVFCESVYEPYDFGSQYSAELNTKLGSNEIPRTEEKLAKIQSAPISIPYKPHPSVFVPARPVPTYFLDSAKLRCEGFPLEKRITDGKSLSENKLNDKRKNSSGETNTKETEEIFRMSPLI
ncbi:hypothetical protein TNCT_545011 [Trichonephila clavata]|uniref:Uncharacterized protein n=1 Tax=Trichonephila clavata TaxID=2740835 RepID=A0A8X6I2M6_TRICU|nr:hypothetical protein TNCT_545011 [Trichonephila clavata]